MQRHRLEFRVVQLQEQSLESPFFFLNKCLEAFLLQYKLAIINSTSCSKPLTRFAQNNKQIDTSSKMKLLPQYPAAKCPS